MNLIRVIAGCCSLLFFSFFPFFFFSVCGLFQEVQQLHVATMVYRFSSPDCSFFRTTTMAWISSLLLLISAHLYSASRGSHGLSAKVCSFVLAFSTRLNN